MSDITVHVITALFTYLVVLRWGWKLKCWHIEKQEVADEAVRSLRKVG